MKLCVVWIGLGFVVIINIIIIIIRIILAGWGV